MQVQRCVGNESLNCTTRSLCRTSRVCAHLINRSERSLAVFGHFFIVLWREAFMALGKRPLASNTAGSDVSFSRVGDVSTPNFQALDSSHAPGQLEICPRSHLIDPFFNHFLMSALALGPRRLLSHAICAPMCVFAQKRVPDAARARRVTAPSAIAIGHVDFDARVCQRSGSLPALGAFA